MKIGQRDVWIGFGKGEDTPRKVWVCCNPLGREWIPAFVGGGKGFWMHDVPRRFEIFTPWWSFVLALTPGSRWGHGSKEDFLNGTYKLKWIEFRRKHADPMHPPTSI